jgi:hypothetical protein
VSDSVDADLSSEKEKEKDKNWDLIWKLRLSACYHRKRERFLDGVDRFTQSVGVLGGAAAFSQVFVQGSHSEISWWNWLPGASVAIISAVALCYGPGTKARKHAELARDTMRLHSKVVFCQTLNASQRAGFHAELLMLESEEPGSLRCLVRQCENELNESDGNADHIKSLSFFEQRCMNLFDLDPSRNLFTRTRVLKSPVLPTEPTSSTESKLGE